MVSFSFIEGGISRILGLLLLPLSLAFPIIERGALITWTEVRGATPICAVVWVRIILLLGPTGLFLLHLHRRSLLNFLEVALIVTTHAINVYWLYSLLWVLIIYLLPLISQIRQVPEWIPILLLLCLKLLLHLLVSRPGRRLINLRTIIGMGIFFSLIVLQLKIPSRLLLLVVLALLSQFPILQLQFSQTFLQIIHILLLM